MAEWNNIMVCVTGQRTCDKLIARGMELKERRENADIQVVHCVETGRYFMGSPFEGDAVEYLFTAAQLAGAELILLRADDVEDALVNYAETKHINTIIMGASPSNGNDNETMEVKLQRRLPQVEFDIVR